MDIFQWSWNVLEEVEMFLDDFPFIQYYSIIRNSIELINSNKLVAVTIHYAEQ